MRHRVRLTAPTGNDVTVPFAPEYMLVKNPTVYTMYIRVGGNDVPASVTSADEYVTPAGFQVFPVDGAGKNFAFGFGAPQISFAPESLPPARADVTFFAGENVPNIGSLPVTNAGIVPSDKLLFYNGNMPANATYTFPITPDVKALAFYWNNNVAYSVYVTGVQTGIQYAAVDVAFGRRIVVPMFDGRDTTLQIRMTNIAGEVSPLVYGLSYAADTTQNQNGIVLVKDNGGLEVYNVPGNLLQVVDQPLSGPLVFSSGPSAASAGQQVYASANIPVGVYKVTFFAYIPTSITVGSGNVMIVGLPGCPAMYVGPGPNFTITMYANVTAPAGIGITWNGGAFSGQQCSFGISYARVG